MHTTLKPKVFVAMSGGVDSSVAAMLLKQRGYDVTGVFMKNWTEGCEWGEDRRDAMAVCAKLGIPFLTFDFTKEYRKEVIDYMLKEYLVGRTPNPDVMCNKAIKFGRFLKKAREMGADFIATGHYTRLRREFLISNFKFLNKSIRGGGQNPKFLYKLLQAKDKNKDQSYFLWTLTQKQLKHCLFPIGNYLKIEVRRMAKKGGLTTAAKKDSQGLCFVGKVRFQDFLKDLINRDYTVNVQSRRLHISGGKIKTTNGKIVGEHKGLVFYTIGQRHGIGVGGGEPYFVAEKDIKNNVLIVAKKNDPALYKKEIFVKDINWISQNNGDTLFYAIAENSVLSKRRALKCKARIRYRQPLQSCRVYAISKNRFKVVFEKPALAVTPGQSVVFYKNSGMLGGGIIYDRTKI